MRGNRDCPFVLNYAIHTLPTAPVKADRSNLEGTFSLHAALWRTTTGELIQLNAS